jgi:hypothetical protein
MAQPLPGLVIPPDAGTDHASSAARILITVVQPAAAARYQARRSRRLGNGNHVIY